MKKIFVTSLRFIELLLLVIFISFFLLKIFIPSVISQQLRNYPGHCQVSSGKIIFEAVVSDSREGICNLISLDVKTWCQGLKAWDSSTFQKALDKRSLFLSGLDVRSLQEWIIKSGIDWYSLPFKGKVFFIIEGKDFHKEIDCRLLLKNMEDFSLEKLIFLGLGLDTSFQETRDKDKAISPFLFLDRVMDKDLDVDFKQNLFLKRGRKVKIAILDSWQK